MERKKKRKEKLTGKSLCERNVKKKRGRLIQPDTHKVKAEGEMHTNGDTKRQGKGERTTETREKRQRRENQEIKEQRHVSNDRYRGERKREADLCFHPCIPIAFGQSCKTVDTTLMPEMHIELNRIASTPLSTAILLASAGESSAEMNHCGAHVAQQEAERHACVCVSPQDRMCA